MSAKRKAPALVSDLDVRIACAAADASVALKRANEARLLAESAEQDARAAIKFAILVGVTVFLVVFSCGAFSEG